MPEVKEKKLSFLSNNLSQDPLKIFFGCQRQRGGTNDNPTVQEYYSNTQVYVLLTHFVKIQFGVIGEAMLRHKRQSHLK